MNALNTTSRRDRFQGALLGLAAGDALGTTVEFESKREAAQNRRGRRHVFPGLKFFSWAQRSRF